MQFCIHNHAFHRIARGATALCVAAAVFTVLALPLQSPAADTFPARPAAISLKKDNVVFHVTTDDPRLWNQALNNMNQVQKILGKDNVNIVLVVNGWGIGMLQMESVVGNRIDEALGKGIKVVACEATMADRKLTRDDMLKGIGYVPGGVIEVIQKQKEGYAYLHL
jgi:uncharacterized protein